MEPNEDIRKLATLVRKYFRLDHCTLCIKFCLNGEKLKPMQLAAVTWIFLNHDIEYVKVLLNKSDSQSLVYSMVVQFSFVLVRDTYLVGPL